VCPFLPAQPQWTGFSTPEGIIVIATSNNPEKLDPRSSTRPSRFDRVWEFRLPGFEERLGLAQVAK